MAEKENRFIIEVSGDPRAGKDIVLAVRKIHRSVQRIDPEVKLEETNFMRLSYRFTWTGTPINFGQIDDVWKAIGKLAGEYFEKWEYSIKVKYIETGG